MRLTDEHYNGDTTTGTFILNQPELTFEQYVEIVKDAGGVHITTTSENMKLSKIPNEFNKWEQSYETAGIYLKSGGKPAQNKHRPFTTKQLAKLKTNFKHYKFFRADFHSNDATENDKKTAINLVGRAACKLRFTRSGLISIAALELL